MVSYIVMIEILRPVEGMFSECPLTGTLEKKRTQRRDAHGTHHRGLFICTHRVCNFKAHFHSL